MVTDVQGCKSILIKYEIKKTTYDIQTIIFKLEKLI